MTEFWRREVTHEAAAILPHVPLEPCWGAEIGVLRAKTACIMLHRRPHLSLVLIDDWREASEGPTGELVYQEALTNLEPFEGRFILKRTDSVSGVRCVPHGVGLAFVHIDADHRYPACLEDMRAWWPLVRPGGYMFCHDIDRPMFPHWGVRQACEEFAAEIAMTNWTVNASRNMAIFRRSK